TFEQLKTPQAESQGRGTIADNRAPLSSSTRAQTALALRDARTEAAFGHAEQNRYTARRIAQGDPGIRLDDETIVRPFSACRERGDFPGCTHGEHRGAASSSHRDASPA